MLKTIIASGIVQSAIHASSSAASAAFLRGSRLLLRQFSAPALRKRAAGRVLLGTTLVFVTPTSATDGDIRAVSQPSRKLSTRPETPRVESFKAHEPGITPNTRVVRCRPPGMMTSLFEREEYRSTWKRLGINDSRPLRNAAWTLLGTAALITAGAVLYDSKKKGEKRASEDLPEGQKAYSPYVRARLRSIFGYAATGIAITAGVSVFGHAVGATQLLSRLHPALLVTAFVVVNTGLIVSVHRQRDPVKKRRGFYAFATSFGVLCAPLLVFGGPLLITAAATTALLCGPLTALAAVAPHKRFLWMRGPVLIALCCVVGASLGQLILPASLLAEAMSLYGGLATFSTMYLLDVMKIVQKLELEEKTALDGVPDKEREAALQVALQQSDPIDGAMSLYLDMLNLFLRILELMAKSKKK